MCRVVEKDIMSKVCSELDLEVMDRKPPITPKVGDWVKIKSKEWYEKWKDSSGTVPVRFAFVEEMKEHCGRIYRINAIPSIEHFYIDELRYTWSMEMFEQVYPQEEYTVYKNSLGENIVKPKVKGPTAMEATQDKEDVAVKTLSKPETKLRIINTNQLIKIDKL